MEGEREGQVQGKKKKKKQCLSLSILSSQETDANGWMDKPEQMASVGHDLAKVERTAVFCTLKVFFPKQKMFETQHYNPHPL